MMAADGNIMRKTPQEAYDLIENMTLHHFQWDAEVYYDTTTSVSAHYSGTTSLLSVQIEVFVKQIAYISQNLQHQLGPGHLHTVYYLDSDKSDEDEPLEAEKSKINPLIREPSDAFVMRTRKSNSILLRIRVPLFQSQGYPRNPWILLI
nr:hypothetical protein [Tanacetum cinerariifolium]